MNTIELTKISSKGQIVIPKHLRKELSIEEGEIFAITGREDTILLKKVSMPTKKELFQKLHTWGTTFARKKGLKEENVEGAVRRLRGK